MTPLGERFTAGSGCPKKTLKAARRRALAHWIYERFQLKVRRACRLAGFSKSGWYAKSTVNRELLLRAVPDFVSGHNDDRHRNRLAMVKLVSAKLRREIALVSKRLHEAASYGA